MWIRLPSSLVLCAGLLVVGVARGAPSPAAPSASSQEDPIEKYRERFKAGMDRYKAGDLAAAIATWEPILRELGEPKGYRLAYDLGVAYAELGDAPHAIERLQASFADARTWAYAAVGTAVGIGVATAALVTWYFLGASRREVVVTPAGVRS
jgi:hypothetical protein